MPAWWCRFILCFILYIITPNWLYLHNLPYKVYQKNSNHMGPWCQNEQEEIGDGILGAFSFFIMEDLANSTWFHITMDGIVFYVIWCFCNHIDTNPYTVFGPDITYKPTSSQLEGSHIYCTNFSSWVWQGSDGFIRKLLVVLHG